MKEGQLHHPGESGGIIGGGEGDGGIISTRLKTGVQVVDEVSTRGSAGGAGGAVSELSGSARMMPAAAATKLASRYAHLEEES